MKVYVILLTLFLMMGIVYIIIYVGEVKDQIGIEILLFPLGYLHHTLNQWIDRKFKWKKITTITIQDGKLLKLTGTRQRRQRRKGYSNRRWMIWIRCL